MKLEKTITKKKGLIFKLITFVGFIVLIFVSLGLSREVYHRYQVKQEIKKVNNEITKLGKRNQELQALVDYLNSESYREIQARQNLGLQKPGEQAVAVEPAPPNEEAQNAGQNVAHEDENKSNPIKWWDYFFAMKD